MSSLPAILRVALSFLLIFCLVAPCPCDATQPADDEQEQAHSCCPSAMDDTVADTGDSHGHDESECSHCGDDTFVSAGSLSLDFVVGDAGGASATCAHAAPLIGRLWADVLVVREVAGRPSIPPTMRIRADLRGSPPDTIGTPDTLHLNVIRC